MAHFKLSLDVTFKDEDLTKVDEVNEIKIESQGLDLVAIQAVMTSIILQVGKNVAQQNPEAETLLYSSVIHNLSKKVKVDK